MPPSTSVPVGGRTVGIAPKEGQYAGMRSWTEVMLPTAAHRPAENAGSKDVPIYGASIASVSPWSTTSSKLGGEAAYCSR